MVRWPGRIKPGTVSDHLGYFPDVMPTLAELAHVDLKHETDGLSIVPTLLGEKTLGHVQSQHAYLYWEDSRSKAIRMGHWKAIQAAKSKVFELYDLSQDIEEKRNIAGRYPDILLKMTAYAQQAHSARRNGKVLDASVGFKGHKAD